MGAEVSQGIAIPSLASSDLLFAGVFPRPHAAPVPSGRRVAAVGGWPPACLSRHLFACKAAWRPSSQPVSLPNVSTVSAPAPQQPAYRSIETIRVGQRAVAGGPDSSVAASSDTAVDPATWRLLRLHAEDRWADGTLDTIEVETLQPPEWIKANDAMWWRRWRLPLDLVEMGMPAAPRGRGGSRALPGDCQGPRPGCADDDQPSQCLRVRTGVERRGGSEGNGPAPRGITSLIARIVAGGFRWTICVRASMSPASWEC